jgi:hypothetical protein
MSLNTTDVSITGRNGLNLELKRLYQTNQSEWMDKVRKNGVDGFANSTYIHDRYTLGPGWSFGYPSVEIKGGFSNDDRVMYYHTGTGNAYKVNFDNSGSHLENMPTDDLVFNWAGDNGFSNGEISAWYYARTIDGTKQYFANDGRLIGIVDRFGNKLVFTHEKSAVGNILANPTFLPSNGSGSYYGTGWATSIPSKMYIYNETMYFNSSTTAGVSAYSDTVNVEGGETYELNGYYKIIGQSLDPFTGDIDIIVTEYNAGGQSFRFTNVEGHSFSNVTECQEFLVNGSIELSTSTKYIEIELKVSSAKGKMYFDNIAFDMQRPLISEIKDDLGRKLAFNYGEYAYKYGGLSAADKVLTVTLTMPDLADGIRNFQYARDIVETDSETVSNGKLVPNHVAFWRLKNYTEASRKMQQYGYNQTGYSSTTKTDPNLKNYFSFGHTSVNTSNDCWMSKVILTDIQLNTVGIHYEYEKTAKRLGTSGYYHTQRVKKRYEYDAVSNLSANSYSFDTSVKYNEQTYSYTSDETNYNNANPAYYTVVVTQGNNLRNAWQYLNGRLDMRSTSDIQNGGNVQEYYNYLNGNFYTLPTLIEITKTDGGQTMSLRKGYEYNQGGRLWKETALLTADEYNNTATRAKYTTTYTYHINGDIYTPNFAIPETKTWYNEIDGALMQETVGFDSLDRPETVTNAKGEVTTYAYNGSYAWLPSSVTQTDINNMDGVSDVSYTASYAWDNGVYPYSVAE